MKACILSNNPASKAIRLSLRPVFLQPGIQLSQLSNDRIGVVVADSKVEMFFKNIGAVFMLDDGSHAFSHVSNIMEASACIYFFYLNVSSVKKHQGKMQLSSYWLEDFCF